MTLRKQLLMIITILFLVIFFATFIVSVKNIQSYLNNTMKSQVTNTAHSLSIAMSQHAIHDKGTLKALVDSYFKTGSYHAIKFLAQDPQNNLERTLEITNPNVPSWLPSMVPLQQQTGEGFVSSNWKQAGKIIVISETNLAYDKLWSDIVELFWVFIIIATITIALGFFALRHLLKPLNDMRIQAAAICSQDFSIINPIPKTKELGTVVDALNQVCRKVHAMFDEQTRLTEKLRSQAYRDALTGLGNRRYFIMQLENYIESREEFTTGSLYLVELKHLDEYKKNHGYEAAELYIKRFAETLNHICHEKNHFLACRISDREFVLLALNINVEETRIIAKELNVSINELHTNIATTIVKYHFGVAYYKEHQTPSEFLAGADMALRAAQSKKDSGWHMYDTEDLKQTLIIGAAGWKEQLEQVVENENILFHYQPVKNIQEEQQSLMHHEVLLRIPDKDNNLLNAGIFIPMAENLNKMIDLDKLVVSKAIEQLSQNNDFKGKYAINLSPSSIHHQQFTDWLLETITENPVAANKLILEFPEQVALHDLTSLQTIVQRLHKLGCEFSLDHFGRGFASFKYLKTIHVDYLKIDGSYIRHIDKDTGNQFFVHVVTEIAHNLGIKTIAENVETQNETDMLKSLNVDGVQGYHIGKPKDKLTQ